MPAPISGGPIETDSIIERWLGRPLLAAYARLLEESPDLRGVDVYFYDAGSLLEHNETYNVRAYSDHYLNIGNNGGGQAFVLDLNEPHAVYLVGHGSMHPDDFDLVSTALSEWIASGFIVPPDDTRDDWQLAMNLSLREATLADAERLAEVFLASRKAFLPFAPSPHTDDEVRAWVRDILLPTEEVTVAVVDHEVVGFVAVKRSEGASWITQLYLAPSSVAQGIGSRLLDHAIATAPFPIRLHTFQQNTGARRFFERSGFVPIQLTDGSANEERCPDVLYELGPLPARP